MATAKKKTAKTTPQNRRFQVSVHTLQMARDCPLRLVLKFLGYAGQEENRSLLCGTAAHIALAAWLRGEDWHESIAYYEDVTAQVNMVDDRRGYPNLVNVLEAVFERYEDGNLPFEVNEKSAVETDFVAPMGTVEVGGESVDVDLIGQIDGVPTDKKTGQPWVLEHKTTGKLDNPYIHNFTWNVQTTAYIWAVQQTTGIEVQKCWVNAIEVKNVPHSERKCPEHGVQYAECGSMHIKQTFIEVTRDAEQLETFRRNALRLSKNLIKCAQYAEKLGDRAALTAPCYGDFTGACEYCEFDAWSLRSRKLETLNTILRKQDMTLDADRLRSGFVK